MLFNSYIFIFAFFPVALILYFGLNRLERYREAQAVLVVLSFVFYAYFHFWYVFILLGSILVNRVLSVQLNKTRQKPILVIGILINLAVIFVFKYYDFFIENINALFASSLPMLRILMPLGISFFTFQQISYLVDSYRGETEGHTFLEYALFVSFFPQLIAGPIVLHEEMIPLFRDKSLKAFHSENFAEGLYLFAVGLAKKVLLADTLAAGADWGYANVSSMGNFNTILVVMLYSMQLYFDFSGYCDMACGIALCFNFRLPVNFLSPYKATSIGDHWKRWHITLTRFLTRYVYFPLGGSRKGKTRTLINIFLVFLISGLWHGAAWTYVAWGAIHGVASVLYRLTSSLWDRLAKWFRIACTYLFVSLSLVPFRSASLSDAGALFSNLFTKPDFALAQDFCRAFDILEFTYLEDHISALGNLIGAVPSLHMWLLFGLSVWIIFFTKNCHEKEFRRGAVSAIQTVVLLVWCILSLAGVSTFLYFNF